MIYTLDYLMKEARGIQAAWNGEDERFMYDGDMLPSEYVGLAQELEQRLLEVEELRIALSL